MRDFNDNWDRTWRIEINITAVKELRAALGVDLLDVGGELLTAMIDDPVALCDVLYVLCKPQADKAGVSDEDFGRGLRGDPIDAAVAAFLEELTDFFPSRRRRLMQAAMEKMQALQERATERAMEVLTGDQLDRLVESKLDERLADAMQGTRGEGSTSSPASSESTPDR